MQGLVRHTLYVFLVISTLTGVLTLSGVCYIWFSSETKDLPYLQWLMTTLIAEVIVVVILLARKGFKYLPETRTDKEQKDTLTFMQRFISTGTSATVVSNRVSWLATNQGLMTTLKQKIDLGIRIEIITPQEVPVSLKTNLQGASFIVTHEILAPDARFTLVNGDRSGAEKLAIARGVHPTHEITIFDNDSGPQIIAMAKDIIRKSKELANAAKVV